MSKVMRFRSWDPKDVNQTIMVVPASDYDALAAQRDEGLERELALNHEILDAKELLHELQQHLSKAEKLANSLLDEYDNSHRDGRPFRAGPLLEQAHSVLASPGCADGEKAE